MNEENQAPASKKIHLGLLVVALIIGAAVVAGIVVATRPNDSVKTTNTTSNQNTPQSTSENQNTSTSNSESAGEVAESADITKAEVASHNSKSDCWTIINNEVYDITAYIPRHPGGDEILRACGTDGTSLFTQRKTADGEEVGSGTAHSSTAEQQLEGFKKGSLKE
jgi:cytoskeletal protein RodZ